MTLDTLTHETDTDTAERAAAAYGAQRAMLRPARRDLLDALDRVRAQLNTIQSLAHPPMHRSVNVDDMEDVLVLHYARAMEALRDVRPLLRKAVTP